MSLTAPGVNGPSAQAQARTAELSPVSESALPRNLAPPKPSTAPVKPQAKRAAVTSTSVRQWLQKLPEFDELDPKPGHYELVVCVISGEVFSSRHQAKLYAHETAHTEFAHVFVRVLNTGTGSWKIGKVSTKPPTAEENASDKVRQEHWRNRKLDQKGEDRSLQLIAGLEEMDLGSSVDSAAAAQGWIGKVRQH